MWVVWWSGYQQRIINSEWFTHQYCPTIDPIKQALYSWRITLPRYAIWTFYLFKFFFVNRRCSWAGLGPAINGLCRTLLTCTKAVVAAYWHSAHRVAALWYNWRQRAYWYTGRRAYILCVVPLVRVGSGGMFLWCAAWARISDLAFNCFSNPLLFERPASFKGSSG